MQARFRERLGRSFLLASLFGGANLCAQMVLSGGGPAGSARIFPTDLAVLEAGEKRTDLPCVVTPVKPLLGFDLRFHAGYEVSVPLRELAGTENLLTVLFRVTPADTAGAANNNNRAEPTYFTQRIKVPAVEEEAKGDAFLSGGFDLGEGNYKVEWLMRDRSERVCSNSWDFTAELAQKDRQIALSIPPGVVQTTDPEQFREEPPVVRASSPAEPPLNLKILINFAPQNSKSATLQPLDTAALVSLLRGISRDPRVGKFSIVAFNLQEQRVVYRQQNTERIDFPALGDALQSLNLGTVDLKRLSQKNGETEFLAELIKRETGGAPEQPAASGSSPDALVFAGPKAMLEENVPAETLKEMGQLRYPVFYMNYNLYPQAVPWRDAIGNAVKAMKGYEYTITRPRDLWFAVSDFISRIVKTRGAKAHSNASSE